MAARENQGLQIALIIFVMLTILLSVSTYMLFAYQEQMEKAKVATNETVAAEKKRQDVEKDRGELLTVIGNAPTDEVKTVLEEAKNDFTTRFQSLGLNPLPEDSRTYKKALVGVLDAIKTKDSTADDRQKEINKYKGQLVDAAAAAEVKIKEITAARDTYQAELDRERTAYKQSVEDLKKEKDTLVTEKTDKNKSMDELKATYEQGGRLDRPTRQVAARGAGDS